MDMATFNQLAFNVVRDGWPKLVENWDEVRRADPGQDDLIAVVQVEQRGCALMPRRAFMKQFRPPSGFEHLMRPAGDMDPPRPRARVMWVLCLGADHQHFTMRVSRDDMLSVKLT